MTKEELMRPRYKLLMDYPGNLCAVGTIFCHRQFYDGCTRLPDKQMDKYPHIFKPLQWWEDRQPEDMPKYLSFQTAKHNVVKISDWGITPSGKVFGNCADGGHCEPGLYDNGNNGYSIATEDEYTTYISSHL